MGLHFLITSNEAHILFCHVLKGNNGSLNKYLLNAQSLPSTLLMAWDIFAAVFLRSLSCVRLYNKTKNVLALVKFIVYSDAAAAAAKSLQSCPTLCNPIDGGPPGAPIPGILQARTLEWVAISFSNAWKGKVKVKSLSRVRLFATTWSAAYQAPPSMGFSRQEYWGGVPLPSPLFRWPNIKTVLTEDILIRR